MRIEHFTAFGNPPPERERIGICVSCVQNSLYSKTYLAKFSATKKLSFELDTLCLHLHTGFAVGIDAELDKLIVAE